MNNQILIVIGILSLLLVGCSSKFPLPSQSNSYGEIRYGEIQRLEGKVIRISAEDGYVVLDSINQYVAVCRPVNNLLREGDFVILIKPSGDLCYDLEKLK